MAYLYNLIFHQRVPQSPNSDVIGDTEMSWARDRVARLKQIEMELQDELDAEDGLRYRAGSLDNN